MSPKSSLDSVLSRAARRRAVPGGVTRVTDRERARCEAAFGQRVLGGGARTHTVGRIALMTVAP